jgi:hypothetical protein
MAVLVFADAARTAGYVTFNLLLLAGFVAVIVGYNRRRARGERAIGWLVGAIVLGLLVLGAIAGAAQG